jgi:hypothetical protein
MGARRLDTEGLQVRRPVGLDHDQLLCGRLAVGAADFLALDDLGVRCLGHQPGSLKNEQ